MTDLDLVAYDFDPRLNRHQVIGEAKSGTGKNTPKPFGIASCGSTVSQTSSAPTPASWSPHCRYRSGRAELASTLRVSAQSMTDIDRREPARITDVSEVGSQGVDAAG